MKQFLSFFSLGLVLGILFIKSEVASWFRIYEMFQFKSFHMYGIIGSAVVLGICIVQYFKYTKAKDLKGEHILITSKQKGVKRYLFGGIIFGLGWALVGACPGPIFALLGSGVLSVVVLLFGALLGTLLFGVLQRKLPY